MSNYLRRIERLEAKHDPKDPLTVFINHFADGPTTRAAHGDEELTRMTNEPEDEFLERAATWAHSLPGQPWGRVVILRGKE
jgi:hypothetical protein